MRATASAVAVGTVLGSLLLASVVGCGNGAAVGSLVPDASPAEQVDAGGDTPPCPAGRDRCGADCVDLHASNEHCGGCGRPCASGERCSAGTCSATGCEDECSTEARECSGTGWRQCGQYDEDACLEWSEVAACGAATACDYATGRCAEGCESECALGSRECSGEGWRQCGEHDSDACLEWSGVVPCGAPRSCDPATVTCVEDCADDCTGPDARECSGAGWRQCGEYDGDPCLEWSGVTACGSGTTCDTATAGCVADCTDECAAGARECSGTGWTQCGQHDADACLEWSAVTPCASGTACDPATSQCVSGCINECAAAGVRQCSGTGWRQCGEYDADSCLEWSAVTPCTAGTSCNSATGQCVAGCTNDCPVSGRRECAGTGWRQCGQFDGDACLEWSAATACTSGYACLPSTGTCQAPCGSYCTPYSLIILPDTQYYTESRNSALDTYRKQAQWIVANRSSEAIKTVIHVGDITDNNKDTEWQVADQAHDILDANGVPYSVTTGNHDYRDASGWSRSNTRFDDPRFFASSRFSGRTWYGGTLGGGSAANNYTYFDNGTTRFMVVSLEYAPRKDQLCEAERIIQAHRDRRVIVATHCYLTANGAYSACDEPRAGVDGEALWNELISRHSNIFLAVSGHHGESFHKTRTGNGGNTVHELVVDYQFEGPGSCRDSNQGYTGNGWLRQMTFDPLKNEVRSRSVTVHAGNTFLFPPSGTPQLFCGYYGSNPTSSDHQFSFAYDLVKPVTYAFNDLRQRGFLDRTVNVAAAGDQLRPRVATAASGFVVAWEDDSSTADGTRSNGSPNHDIKVRGFKHGGCGGFAELVVNATTSGHQATPDLAMNSTGQFVVAWADDSDGNGSYQIYARGFSATGAARFSIAPVNSVATGEQIAPVVAMAPDGRFVVAWQDSAASNGKYQIKMRGFNADGTQRFAERTVNTTTTGTHVAPAIALDPLARIVVAWQDDSDANGSYQIRMRGFNADGSDRFSERTVNSQAAGQQEQPAIGIDASGQFVVAWEDDAADDGKAQILARGFDAGGNQRIADFAVPGAAAGNRVAPAVAMESNGDFAVTWQDDSDGNGTFQIRARAFRAGGTEWKAAWTVNREASGQQYAPGVALLDGTAVFAWQDDADDNDAYQILARGVQLP